MHDSMWSFALQYTHTYHQAKKKLAIFISFRPYHFPFAVYMHFHISRNLEIFIARSLLHQNQADFFSVVHLKIKENGCSCVYTLFFFSLNIFDDVYKSTYLLLWRIFTCSCIYTLAVYRHTTFYRMHVKGKWAQKFFSGQSLKIFIRPRLSLSFDTNIIQK